MVTKESKQEDWFEKLQSDLNKKSEEILKGYNLESDKKRSINIEMVQDLWRIYLKFVDVNVHFTLDPPATNWASFTDYPTNWKIRDEYNFGALNSISFVDTTREDDRTGDALKMIYELGPDGEKIKITFEFFEGEKYYKYSGWKRTYEKHVLYESLVSKSSIDEIHNILSDLILKWYESHLKRDRNLLLNHIKEKYPITESFTE
ncbi:MAG: hypothetical protein ACP5NL_03400 [Thermoplasmata archaeon]